jgi:hypothetical protein
MALAFKARVGVLFFDRTRARALSAVLFMMFMAINSSNTSLEVKE